MENKEQSPQTNNNNKNHQHNNNNNNNRRRHHNNNNNNNNHNNNAKKEELAVVAPKSSSGKPLQERSEAQLNRNGENESAAAAAVSKSSNNNNNNNNNYNNNNRQQSKAHNQHNNNNNNNRQQSKAHNQHNNNNNNNNNHRRQNNNNNYNNRQSRVKNTVDFSPHWKSPEMRVVMDLGAKKLTSKLSLRDVVLAPNIFNQPGDETIYDRIMDEVKKCSVPFERLSVDWHQSSHQIANDRTGWSKECPTFNKVVERAADFFQMKVNATRLNFYKNSDESHKPMHHDAAAIKPHIAKSQNFTVALSFGCSRTAAFEDAKHGTVISFPLPNGTCYCFSGDTNILWRHGILPRREEESDANDKRDRISVILWGYVPLCSMFGEALPCLGTSSGDGYK